MEPLPDPEDQAARPAPVLVPPRGAPELAPPPMWFPPQLINIAPASDKFEALPAGVRPH